MHVEENSAVDEVTDVLAVMGFVPANSIITFQF